MFWTRWVLTTPSDSLFKIDYNIILHQHLSIVVSSFRIFGLKFCVSTFFIRAMCPSNLVFLYVVPHPSSLIWSTAQILNFSMQSSSTSSLRSETMNVSKCFGRIRPTREGEAARNFCLHFKVKPKILAVIKEERSCYWSHRRGERSVTAQRQDHPVIRYRDVMRNYGGSELLPRHNSAPPASVHYLPKLSLQKGITKPCHVKAT